MMAWKLTMGDWIVMSRCNRAIRKQLGRRLNEQQIFILERDE